jgi:membrane protein implicated in regulation of membrane protease activity
MSSANASGRPESVPPDRAVHMPPTRTGFLVAAGVCLLVPLVALMWVGSYAKETPRLWGIPFFFWYQFVWVFVTSALTYTAHRLVLAARGPRSAGPGPDGPAAGIDPRSGS